MRFIGNKQSIAPVLIDMLHDLGLTGRGLTFFDAFCGTGAVADCAKPFFDIKINDLLEWCTLYSQGRIVSAACAFDGLGFDPFALFADPDRMLHGYIHDTYSPGGSSRMYFTEANAARIDHISATIRQWRTEGRITDDEYAYLLASLIESVSAVANIAGVYGAYLKHWDPRALKPLQFQPVAAAAGPGNVTARYNRRIEDIVADVECDVLYLDPPYTQNQYGTQYHLLETLVKQDDPSISPITGSRPTGPMRSDWSKDVRKHILFEQVVATTRAKHILFSYSSDGFMSQDYIESVLRRHGIPGTMVCKPVAYPNYTNTKSRRNAEHREYIYYIEKKPPDAVIYASPVNYIGSKYRMVDFLTNHFPAGITTFVDAFGGGGTVAANAPAPAVIYNDYNHLVAELLASFRATGTFEYVNYVKRIINRFGLKKEDAQAYAAARAYYNGLPEAKRDPRLLYAVILYSFNQQIRFNADLQFNNPVGQRWFNERLLEKMISFSRAMKSKAITFKSVDYEDLLAELDEGAFVYMDPPYRLTTGVYNDGKRGFKGWDHEAEERLFAFADRLDRRSTKFMLSYVRSHKGLENHRFEAWIGRNAYRVIAHDRTQGIGRQELIVINYE